MQASNMKQMSRDVQSHKHAPVTKNISSGAIGGAGGQPGHIGK